MIIQTRDFGEIEINKNDIMKFISPIIGFDEYTEFVFLYEEDGNKQYAWLQSVEEKDLCFIVINPDAAVSDYDVVISKETKKILGDGKYDAWLIMVVADDLKKSTVNLKSPVLVNPNNNTAAQIMLDADLPIRYPLFDKERRN